MCPDACADVSACSAGMVWVQVRRLIRVLSVRGVRRGDLLDASGDAILEQLSSGDMHTLQECGWVAGAGICGLLNFRGEPHNMTAVSGQGCSSGVTDVTEYVCRLCAGVQCQV